MMDTRNELSRAARLLIVLLVVVVVYRQHRFKDKRRALDTGFVYNLDQSCWSRLVDTKF